MNVQVDELVIKEYTCPLCGGQVHNVAMYSKWFEYGVWWLFDTTPCCDVFVAWLPIDGVLIYVGTFRNEDAFVQWADSAGEYSGLLPVGLMWDHEKQGPLHHVDEIPF